MIWLLKESRKTEKDKNHFKAYNQTDFSKTKLCYKRNASAKRAKEAQTRLKIKVSLSLVHNLPRENTQEKNRDFLSAFMKETVEDLQGIIIL